MNYRIRFKKLGSHWYPDIEHSDPYSLILDEKVEKCLNLFNKSKSGILDICFWETYTIIDDATIMFEDSDILRYLTTEDDFNLSFYIDDHKYLISSNLFYLLELDYNFNFHKTFYRIEILDRTI
ncbi:MAG: hypothetical protein IJ193_08940 [Bacilli bacterium]|nr:hypothetical protein [Bacilli bacterium]